ncbi:MAG: tetratricopeptide repeat protein [Rhodobacteraceae bacterium]|nr:tetratricopeptide repeat protein [Paracoccaceae bacterium]
MPVRFPVLIAVLTALAAPVASATEDAGAYLAARQASIDTDYREAVGYYARALVADPGNPVLMENLMTAQIGLGEVDNAVAVARRMLSSGAQSQLANLVLMAKAAKGNSYDRLLEDYEAGMAISPLVDGLAIAWAELGQGHMSEALAAFDAVIETDGMMAFGLFHKALALASVGDFEGADAILAGQDMPALSLTRRGVIAHAAILSQLERNADALDLIDGSFGAVTDPQLSDIRSRLADGETLPYEAIRNAQDGLAEVFYGIAGALSGEANQVFTLIYSRMVEYLRPDHTDAILLTSAVFEDLGQFELATESYSRISKDHPSFYVAEIGRAEAMRQTGDVEGAIDVLTALGRSHAEIPTVHITLGDFLRREERYADATPAYTRAIDLFPEPDATQWITYFARGITYERTDRWPEAEADLRKALELNPDQPQVLNYLGYSFVEMQENMDEALNMIERAVAARPNDGYITDSLGWVLYRLGRYDEAVGHMEHAAELMPVDPIVNDHLGDVYWAVGREVEAQFQWRRALSFDPEEDEAERIRRKLEVGLDKVLEEEGAEPLHASEDG